MMYENILVETRGRVGLVTLNRPKALNALNDALMNELGAPDGHARHVGVGRLGEALNHPRVVFLEALPLLLAAQHRLQGAEGLDEAVIGIQRGVEGLLGAVGR
jgi:hypothetical protein